MRRLRRRRLLRLAASGAVGVASRRSDGEGTSTAGGPATDEGTSRQRVAFDPVDHGFAFTNWEGNTGTGADGEEFTYEPSEVTRTDVRQAIDDSWSTVLSKAQKAIMTRIVHAWIGGGAATNGHCYGMAFAADYYWRNPSQLPGRVDVTSDVPHPTGPYNAVGDRIRWLQTSQLLRAEVYWFALFGLRWGLADHRASLDRLTETIDATGTAGLGISSPKYTHQVLAHDYERGDGVTDLAVYDPTYEAAEHEDPEDVWRLSVDQETGEVYEIADGYEEFLYHDPEMDGTDLEAVIGGHERVLQDLSSATFLGLEDGDALELDVPDGVTVDRPAAEYADPDAAPYADAAVVIGSPDRFEIAIDGAEGDPYTLEAVGLDDGEIALDEILTGTLDAVPARLRVTADEAGEFVVDAVEDVEAEANTIADQAARDVPLDDATGEWLTDNWWAPAAGIGGLGLGVAYRLLTRRSRGEE